MACAVEERRTTATTRRVPPQRGQVRTSVWNVRLRSSAQGMGRLQATRTSRRSLQEADARIATDYMYQTIDMGRRLPDRARQLAGGQPTSAPMVTRPAPRCGDLA
jgi:hypothetical protein